MGKTVTTEFATFQPAATRNPAAPGRSPGGSSSGSAAVVADYMAPLALGTQTAGSVIRPASYCGIFGFKPTYGAISFQGIKALSASLDTVGVFARSEEDLVLLWNVLVDGRWHQRARMRLPMRRSGPIRVALAELPESHLADDSVHAALEAMAGAIAVCAMWGALLWRAHLNRRLMRTRQLWPSRRRVHLTMSIVCTEQHWANRCSR